MIEEQYIDCCANGEANIVTKNTADGAFGFENMASPLDEYNTVEIFIFSKNSGQDHRPQKAIFAGEANRHPDIFQNVKSNTVQCSGNRCTRIVACARRREDYPFCYCLMGARKGPYTDVSTAT